MPNHPAFDPYQPRDPYEDPLQPAVPVQWLFDYLIDRYQNDHPEVDLAPVRAFRDFAAAQLAPDGPLALSGFRNDSDGHTVLVPQDANRPHLDVEPHRDRTGRPPGHYVPVIGRSAFPNPR